MTSRKIWRGLSLLTGSVFGLGVAALPAQAPSATIRGVVLLMGARTPIEGARITLIGTEYSRTTDAKGAFQFSEVRPGKYVIQAAAIGYSTMAAPIELKEAQQLELEFEAEAESVELPEITVEAEGNHGHADFNRRRVEGRGRYLTREDIERRNPGTLPDVFRAVAGVRVDCRNLMVCSVRMARAARCNPAFFMDGVPTDPAVVYLTPVGEIEGIEIYNGPSETPPELESYQARCGVIVLWTKSPPPRRPKKPKKPPTVDTLPDSLRVQSGAGKGPPF